MVTAGILEMSEVRTAVSMISDWVAHLETLTPRDTAAIFMGTHARIPALAPIAFKTDAYAWQGNAQIRRWTATVKAASQRLRVIDPFALTEQLDETYRDTEDGLHFGQWINLQKFQSVLREINTTAY